MKLIRTQGIAPGKIILSGEHAVVYGHPALVMAINRYVTTVVQASNTISFVLPNLESESITFDDLIQLKNRLRIDYQRYKNGDLSIREVLHSPIELVQFALSVLLESAGLESIAGIKLEIKTDIPLGCGMGSSAAVILSILSAVAHSLEISLAPEQMFGLALEAENLQHGQSSGLDLICSLQGGCLFYTKNNIALRTPPLLPLYLINTGQPQTTTGECVAKAAMYFKKTQIGNDFASVTNVIDIALQSSNQENIKLAIRENHKLLNTIGVVPERVQQLIAEIELHGGAAKVSGAGAVRGHTAGAVLAVMEDEALLAKITARYQLNVSPVHCEARGVYLS